MPDSNFELSELLRTQELAFFGRITANVTHELNNIISIIDQSAGLLGDLIAAVQFGRPIPEEKLQRISDNISTQSKRGFDFIKRLNTFAHTTDDPVKDFELIQLIENLVALTRRFADLKNVSLESRFAEGSIKIRNNPFQVQQAVFCCIDLALGVSEKDDSILVRCSRENAHAVITIRCNPIPETEDTIERFGYLDILVDQLNCEMIHSQQEAGSEIRFKLHLKP